MGLVFALILIGSMAAAGYYDLKHTQGLKPSPPAAPRPTSTKVRSYPSQTATAPTNLTSAD